MKAHTTKVAEDTQVKVTDAIDAKGAEVKDVIEEQGKATKEGLSQIERSIAEVRQIVLESAKKETRRVEQLSDIVPGAISLDKRFASAESTAASTEATEELDDEKYSLANLRKFKLLGRLNFTNKK